ncbi:NUDIX domain-containing protein [Kitasatospora cineracea]|uniref:NUDIX domain-containing protein n=1 Tax=Kitasatospora cineracea TaxID=88074 RepID=UPI0036D88D15
MRGWTPEHPSASYLLCTDPASRLLIVRGVRAAGAGVGSWDLPGGEVGAGESPLDAVRREVRRELGLAFDLLPDDLLGVEWAQARGAGARDRLVFLWSGPMLSAADTDRIVLDARELTDWRWAGPDEARLLLHPVVADRARERLRWPGGVTYHEARGPAGRTRGVDGPS